LGSEGDFLSKLNRDLLEQFRGREQTEVLMQAIARQLDEVYRFFIAIQKERDLANSIGQQLDGVGDIVVMTRFEASVLAGQLAAAIVMDDDLYRDYLLYKAFLNTSSATYFDIHSALSMFWREAPLIYSEDPDVPATIFFNSSLLGQGDRRIFANFPLIKPAGVRIFLTIGMPLYRFENVNEFHFISFTWHDRWRYRGGQPYIWNGAVDFDGSIYFGQEYEWPRVRMPVFEFSGMSFRNSNNLGDAFLWRPHDHRLDGTWLLDGSKQLNSSPELVKERL